MTLSIPLNPPAIRGRAGVTLAGKLFTLLALVALGDAAFGSGGLGAASAAFGAVWLLALWVTKPAMRRSRGAMVAFAFAWAMTLMFVEDPSALAGWMFWCAVALAALLPRAARFDDAGRWFTRVAFLMVTLLLKPIDDIRLWLKVKRRGRTAAIAERVIMLALPVAGVVVFSALFANANPIVGRWFADWRPGSVLTGLSTGRVLLWGAVAVAVWSTLRPSRLIRLVAPAARSSETRALPGVSLASVTISLVLFNALFAIENGLDIAFLWSGAPLPDGVTLADYAHQGAYPLIVTVLLAAAFVLVALRPGTPMAASTPVRWMVSAWIAQNVFLVASSALRTLDYVEVYSLTRLRIAALVWMAVVALGLALICWRIVRARSHAWLINANAAVLVVALSGCAVVDLGSVAARWNVRHSIWTQTGGNALDEPYLAYLGPSALGAMLELERSTIPDSLRDRLAAMRSRTAAALRLRQQDWRTWTWRGARRLAEEQAAPVYSPPVQAPPAAPAPDPAPAPAFERW